MRVSKFLRSAVNWKYISGILSPDWTGVGYQKMSLLCMAKQRTHVTDKTLDISDACMSAELFNTLKILWEKNLNTTSSTFNLWPKLMVLGASIPLSRAQGCVSEWGVMHIWWNPFLAYRAAYTASYSYIPHFKATVGCIALRFLHSQGTHWCTASRFLYPKGTLEGNLWCCSALGHYSVLNHVLSPMGVGERALLQHLFHNVGHQRDRLHLPTTHPPKFIIATVLIKCRNLKFVVLYKKKSLW